MLNMTETNEGNNPDALTIVAVKRKRGRPRKFPRLDRDHGGNAYIMGDQNLSRGYNVRVPPGFEGASRDQPHQGYATNDANDGMVGQVVHGVIDAAFDAGYLLTVRVGNSETTLRGVVFKPGHYVPVSADNDVAPDVQMIRRNDIRVPREIYTRIHTPWSRDRNETAHESQVSNVVASKGKQVVSMPSQGAASGVLRGNMVPVVLQPVNLANGSAAASEPSSAAIEAASPVVSKGKQVLYAAHTPNESTSPKQVAAAQDNRQMMASGVQNETTSFTQDPAETLHVGDAKSMDLPNMPFAKLLNEVIKGTVPSELMQSNSSSASKLSGKDSGLLGEDDASDTSEAISAEPLQALQPNIHNQHMYGSGPLENYRTGKMTELLQVLQDTMTENKATQAEEPGFDLRSKLD